MLVTPNRAELVAAPPSKKSSVRLSGAIAPLVLCQKLITDVATHSGSPPAETDRTAPSPPIPSLSRFPPESL